VRENRARKERLIKRLCYLWTGELFDSFLLPALLVAIARMDEPCEQSRKEPIVQTNGRRIGIIASICLLVTLIWLALLIYQVATRGAVESFEQALAYASELDPLHYLIYTNATLITLSATMLFGGLYVACRAQDPTWSAMGLAFLPVYTVLNLFVYLSQIAILPRLAALRPASDFLLAQLVQAWSGSAVNFLNNLGYAVLGIPSIIFGLLLGRVDRSLRWAGLLLALSGAPSILGVVGIVAGSAALGLGSIAGGALFLVALVPLSVTLQLLSVGTPGARTATENAPSSS